LAKATFESFADLLTKKADARLGLVTAGQVLDVISTGSVALDRLSGIKGIPKGRITQIASDPGVGKSTTALNICSHHQKAGGRILYLDFEQAMTAEYAQKMGCNLEDGTMILLQPTDMDAGWEVITKISELGVTLIVLDSIASMQPMIEEEKQAQLSQQIGIQARGLANFFPRLKNYARVKNFAVIAINQVRAKLEFGFGAGIQRTPAYSQALPGGYAVKFNTDLLYYLSIKKTEKEKGTLMDGSRGDTYVGTEITATTWKNKVGMPFRKVPLYLTFGQGIDDARSVLELALSHDVIEMKKAGYWSITNDGTYPGGRVDDVLAKGQGEDNISPALESDPDLYTYVRNRVLNLTVSDTIPDAEAADIKAYMSDDSIPSAFIPPIQTKGPNE